MNWFINFLNFFDSNKVKELRKIAPKDEILICTPNGYYQTINGTRMYDQPFLVTVMNNYPIACKLWVYFSLPNDDKVQLIIKYNSKELKDYILLNVENMDFRESAKSREELENELKNAISNDNFEMAALINKKLKNLN